MIRPSERLTRFLRGPLGTAGVDLAVLSAVFVLLGTLLVGAHWTSSWVDREFTGWIAPLAHQVGEGPRMYEDGRHSPLPPLCTLLLWAAAPRPATWYAESLAIFLFQSGTLVVMYGVLRSFLSRRSALWTVLAGAPVFFAVPKTVLYDFAPQFLVALILAGMIAWHRSYRRGVPTRATWSWIALLGGLSATVLLTKQSTGLGAVAGVGMAIVLFPRGVSAGRRATGLGVYAGATGAAFALWCAAISPLVSIPGMLVDVFLAGSEPKGGPAQMVQNLLGYAAQIVRLSALVGLVALAIRGARRSRAWQAELLKEKTLRPMQVRALWWLGGILPLACCALACLICVAIDPRDGSTGLHLAPLTCGLAVLLGVLAGAFLPLWANAEVEGGPVEHFVRQWFRPPRPATGLDSELLPPLVLVALAAATFHNLSAAEFRWTDDNNPLVLLALGAVAAILCEPAPRISPAPCAGKIGEKIQPVAIPAHGMYWVRGACLAATTALCWTLMLPQWQAARECRVAWSEVSHLRGARLRAKAEGMRELVGLVRHWAPRSDDRVLMLPGDPNLEAWLARERPELTSSILFTDQYWDRYVEEDLRRLRANPPQVIVVGPRLCWRPFARVWHADWGAERLIDEVQQTLIPENYQLVGSAPIILTGMTDYMDVYARVP